MSAEMATLTCRDVSDLLPAILDGEARSDLRVTGHVEGCIACQAELARYRRVVRLLHQLRAYRIDPPDGTVGDVIAALEQVAERRMVRFALRGRRLAYAGALLAAPTAAALGLSVARRSRLRRVPPVVLS